jgi:peptidoglycan-associated lipoprotein
MLTERRGQNVRQFLVDLGVTGENMQVIAKGDLEASGTEETSWAKDRRVQFIWP